MICINTMSSNRGPNCRALYALILLSLFTFTLSVIMKWIPFNSVLYNYAWHSSKMQLTNNTSVFNIYHFNENEEKVQRMPMALMHKIPENKRQFFYQESSRSTKKRKSTVDELLGEKLCLRDIKISVLGDSTASRTRNALYKILNCTTIDHEHMVDGHLPGIEYFSNSGILFYSVQILYTLPQKKRNFNFRIFMVTLDHGQ